MLRPPPPAVASKDGEVQSVDKAREAVMIGKSTQPEVEAALGKAIVVDFASGYEVWVYREKVPPTERPDTLRRAAPNAWRNELVVLFAPDGRAVKVRVRPPG